jgi:hypothetical protein
MLDESGALELADNLFGIQAQERTQLDVLRRYVTGKQALPLVIPRDAPAEVREMARIARVNLIAIVVNSLVESMYVDNLRVVSTPDAGSGDPDEPATRIEGAEDAEDVTHEVWRAWQANKMDRAQSGLYRAVFTYGYGYAIALRGAPLPVIKVFSPRTMTALYGDDPDWPEVALERRRQPNRYRLYDDECVYELGHDPEKKRFALLGVAKHGSPYCPVVRYRDAEDLDLDDEPVPYSLQGGGRDNVTDMIAGQVAPLMTLQDQADVTSFMLKSAEWYAAFRQRWVVGWTPSAAGDRIQAAASQLWTFDDSPDDIKLGEFSETSLDGYLRSRQETLKYAATLSQTPVHELIGELVNMSAEALAAAEAGRDRKVEERKTGLGESHEQLAGIVGELMGVPVPDDMEVVWRDTSARSFAAIVDGLGKLAAQLQIPPEMLWDRIPGVTRQDVRRWKLAREEGDAIGALTGMLDRQAADTPAPPAATGERTSPGGVILPPGTRA